jgi:hypothetical protein
MHNMQLKSIGKICKNYAQNCLHFKICKICKLKQYAGFNDITISLSTLYWMQYAKYAKIICTICKKCKRYFQYAECALCTLLMSQWPLPRGTRNNFKLNHSGSDWLIGNDLDFKLPASSDRHEHAFGVTDS